MIIWLSNFSACSPFLFTNTYNRRFFSIFRDAQVKEVEEEEALLSFSLCMADKDGILPFRTFDNMPVYELSRSLFLSQEKRKQSNRREILQFMTMNIMT